MGRKTCQKDTFTRDGFSRWNFNEIEVLFSNVSFNKGMKWFQLENDPPIVFDGKKLDLRKNIAAPDGMYKLLAEIALSLLNDQKIINGQPFRKELNKSLGYILDQEISGALSKVFVKISREPKPVPAASLHVNR